jgi:zinc D-Ala-D-Ala dipeptidase
MARRVAGEAGRLNRRQLVVGASLVSLLGGCRQSASQPAQSAAKPTVPVGKPGDLVELIKLDPDIKLDIRYATPNNFTGMALYDQPRAFLVRAAAEALIRVQARAKAVGFGLTIFDGYRPLSVTKKLWDATPPGPKRNYVANPAKGSRHNRGCAVDLSLHDLKTGALVEMPSGYDDFSLRAHRDFMNASSVAIANRERLERHMEVEGFRGMSNEWWHFDFRGWENFPILNIPFAEID